MNAKRVGVVVLSSVGMAATFLPWAGIGMLGVSGTAGDGWMTLAAFFGALSIAVFVRRTEPLTGGMRAGILGVSVLALAVGITDLSKVASGAGAAFVGPGLWLVCVAGVALCLVAAFGGRWWQPTLAILALIITGAVGGLHFAYGDSVGFKVCKKGTWSLVDTFVDVDEYMGKTLADAVSNHHEAVVQALFDCDLFEKFELSGDAPGCRIGGEQGYCMDESQCNGETQRGVCPGTGNIICCVPVLKAP